MGLHIIHDAQLPNSVGGHCCGSWSGEVSERLRPFRQGWRERGRSEPHLLLSWKLEARNLLPSKSTISLRIFPETVLGAMNCKALSQCIKPPTNKGSFPSSAATQCWNNGAPSTIPKQSQLNLRDNAYSQNRSYNVKSLSSREPYL